MADNVQLNSPTTYGAIIATDEVDSAQHQLMKLEFGGDGVATKVSAADPLPTADAAVLAKLSNDPATQTTLAALLAKVIAAPSTEAKQDVMITGLAAILSNQQTNALTNVELRATPVPVSGTVSVDTSLLSTAAKQDAQTALLTTLNSLIETNNTLIQLLSPLAAAMNSGAPALRVAPISSQSTAVTGTLTGVTTVTTVSTLTNFGTGIPAKEMADDMNNLVVTMANINNVTA